MTLFKSGIFSKPEVGDTRGNTYFLFHSVLIELDAK